MPDWRIHDKWAERLGFERKISLSVNLHEDQIWPYDNPKKGKPVPDIPERLDFMRQKGEAYELVWLLHSFLDLVEHSPRLIGGHGEIGHIGHKGIEYKGNVPHEYYTIREAQEAIDAGIERFPSPHTREIAEFVKKHIVEIFQDCIKVLMNYNPDRKYGIIVSDWGSFRVIDGSGEVVIASETFPEKVAMMTEEPSSRMNLGRIRKQAEGMDRV